MLKDLNKIEVGMKVKQIKELGYEQFDRLGREFEVKEVKENVIMCSNGSIGFGISRNEFFEYFEAIPEPANNVTFVEVKDGIRTIRNGKVTVVILPNGTKGVSKCMEEDTYDAQIGYEIAYRKAIVKKLQKELKGLCK